VGAARGHRFRVEHESRLQQRDRGLSLGVRQARMKKRHGTSRGHQRIDRLERGSVARPDERDELLRVVQKTDRLEPCETIADPFTQRAERHGSSPDDQRETLGAVASGVEH
jgi:hypothetical protein